MEARWRLEKPINDIDKVPSHAPGTPERKALLTELERTKNKTAEIPLVINGEPVTTGEIYEVRCPHDHGRVLAKAHLAGESEIAAAIDGALAAHESWASLEGYQRAAVISRAADMLEGPRRIEACAAIMANQSKTPFEAEIDIAELVDFWRFNVYAMQFIFDSQPDQFKNEINRMDWRPLEGFVLAVCPFNFFAIAGNLPTAPAMVGNVALWKPSLSTLHSNYVIMDILLEAGLPPGVIQFLPFDEKKHSDRVINHRDLGGLHFTGSYPTLVHLWQKVSANLPNYKNFPRIVGETGGKDFIVVHPSAKRDILAPNIIRGAFEYQGQKCSAASRLYAPESLWPELKAQLLDEVQHVKHGPVEGLDVFMGAIIDEKGFRKVTSYIDHAKENSNEYEILHGGEYDDSKGWFISPTLIQTSNPNSKLITEEIFGPVLTIYVYPDSDYDKVLDLVDSASPYALTGAIFAQDRQVIEQAQQRLRYTAGNFYINDKPTGSIVGRQPFGGARHSGTNDKAGSWINLTRWLSPRTIKETLVPPTSWPRPYQG